MVYGIIHLEVTSSRNCFATSTTALVFTADEATEDTDYSIENSWFNFSILQGLGEVVYDSSKNNSIRTHS